MTVAAVVSAAKPCDRLELDDAVAHRAHDPPAARSRAQRDGGGGEHDDPPRDLDVVAVGMTPAETSARVMMPIVFWASLEPWAKAMNPADTTWRRRKRWASGRRAARRKIQKRATIRMNAPKNPISGEVTSGIRTLLTIPSTFEGARRRPRSTVAPRRPPIRAWLLELGMPSRQVIRFQTIAPRSAATDHGLRGGRLVDEARADRLGHGRPGEGPDEVERGRHDDRVARDAGPASPPTWRSRWPCRGSR